MEKNKNKKKKKSNFSEEESLDRLKDFYCDGGEPKLRNKNQTTYEEDETSPPLAIEQAVEFVSSCVTDIYHNDYNGTKELYIGNTTIVTTTTTGDDDVFYDDGDFNFTEEFSCNEPHYDSYIYKVRQVQIWADGIFLTVSGKQHYRS